MSTKQRQAHAWGVWINRLPPPVRAALSSVETTRVTIVSQRRSADSDDYGAWRKSLPEIVRDNVDQLVHAAELPEPADPSLARFCMVEVDHSGEHWPMLKVFQSARQLAVHLGKLEKEDVSVWPFFGVPLRFTEGPQRYLLLPDGTTAMMIPLAPGGPTPIVDAGLLATPLKDGNFLGPPELEFMQRVVVESKTKLIPAKKKDDDDEEDDDDDEEEGEKKAKRK